MTFLLVHKPLQHYRKGSARRKQAFEHLVLMLRTHRRSGPCEPQDSVSKSIVFCIDHISPELAVVHRQIAWVTCGPNGSPPTQRLFDRCARFLHFTCTVHCIESSSWNFLRLRRAQPQAEALRCFARPKNRAPCRSAVPRKNLACNLNASFLILTAKPLAGDRRESRSGQQEETVPVAIERVSPPPPFCGIGGWRAFPSQVPCA